MNILEIKDLSKIYDSNGEEVRALDGVSLEIKQGEIFGLLGVNGAGKTTLSSILATLHPPTSGSVLFRGKSIYDKPSRLKIGSASTKESSPWSRPTPRRKAG